LGVELLGIVPEVEEDLLGDLLGGRVAAEDPAGEGVDGATVAALHLGQRLLVPPADGDDQVGVARLLQVHEHAPYSEPAAIRMRVVPVLATGLGHRVADAPIRMASSTEQATMTDTGRNRTRGRQAGGRRRERPAPAPS
jgi:hypothetical protein